MKITWIGHSCFRIESKEFSIIIDPYADGSVPGYGPVRETANMVLCSHGHGDHNGTQCVEIENRNNDGITITKIETFHDNQQGAQRGKNTIHIFDDGESKIAHLGDLGCGITKEQAEHLGNLDAVLIPVGGYYTIDSTEAKKIIEQIKPKMVIPMHYSSDDKNKHSFGYNVLDGVSGFLEDFDSVQTLSVSEVNTDTIPARVVVLQPKNVINE